MSNNLILKEGIYTNQQLAEWFGISLGSFKNTKRKKLEELRAFADFEEKSGKVNIIRVYEPIYSKQLKKTQQMVMEKIDGVWSEDGLDTCSRVGTEICQLLEEEGIIRQPATIINYTRKGRDELYGKPFFSEGTLGSCRYIWCKRNKADGSYSMLTAAEEKIKQDLQVKYFGNVTEKQLLVKEMITAGEINKEEAWEILEKITNMGTPNFLSFLKELQEKLNCQIVRGTLVERK